MVIAFPSFSVSRKTLQPYIEGVEEWLGTKRISDSLTIAATNIENKSKYTI
jgi:hypothetical protein